MWQKMKIQMVGM
jgi:hypothetical protein